MPYLNRAYALDTIDEVSRLQTMVQTSPNHRGPHPQKSFEQERFCLPCQWGSKHCARHRPSAHRLRGNDFTGVLVSRGGAYSWLIVHYCVPCQKFVLSDVAGHPVSIVEKLRESKAFTCPHVQPKSVKVAKAQPVLPPQAQAAKVPDMPLGRTAYTGTLKFSRIKKSSVPAPTMTYEELKKKMGR